MKSQNEIQIEVDSFLLNIMPYIRANNNEDSLKIKMSDELYNYMLNAYEKGFTDAQKIYGK